MASPDKLHSAVCAADLELVKALLNEDQEYNLDNRDTKGLNVIHLAARNGNYDILCELLKNSPLVDSIYNYYLEGCTALHLAAHRGHSKVVGLLVEYGADINAGTFYEKRTALHEAASMGHLSTVATLLEHGAQVEAIDSNGNTALFFGVKHVEITRYLINNGCPVNQLNRFKRSALYQAVIDEADDTIRLLIASGDDIDRLDVKNETVVMKHANSYSHSLKTMKLLLEYRPKILVRPKDRYTLLHMVAPKATVKMIDLLVMDTNIDINAVSVSGDTAIEVALNYCNAKAIQRLLEFGSATNISHHSLDQLLPNYDSEDNDFNDTRYFLCNATLNQFSTKMMVINPKYNGFHNSRYSKSENNTYKNVCQLENSLLKNIDVCGGDPDMRISCHKIITMGVESVIASLRYFDLESIFKTDLSKVPEYAGIVEGKLLLACKRLSLVKTLENMIHSNKSLLSQSLPNLVFEELVNYLTNDDLENFIAAFSANVNPKNFMEWRPDRFV